MGIENTGPWKHSEEKMKTFLGDADKGEKGVNEILGSENKEKEQVIQTSSNELSRINTEVLTSNEVVEDNVADLENVKEFLANLSDQTKQTLGELRYNGWSGENTG